jgi:hypothetical protein
MRARELRLLKVASFTDLMVKLGIKSAKTAYETCYGRLFKIRMYSAIARDNDDQSC